MLIMPQKHEDTKAHKGQIRVLSDEEERIGTAIVNAAYVVHKTLGPGLLEKIYEMCFCYMSAESGFLVKRQVDVPIVFKDMIFEEGLRIDVLVNDLVICELKAVENVNPVWEAQLLSHLKLTGKRLVYLINFNVPLIKDGIKRMIV
ncbi:MAG: GxxExxY protein [Bacteroidia bacterium]